MTYISFYITYIREHCGILRGTIVNDVNSNWLTHYTGTPRTLDQTERWKQKDRGPCHHLVSTRRF